MQDHVHSGESAGRRVFFLSVERDGCAGLVGDFQQQRAGAACRIVNRCAGARLRGPDAEDLGHDAADLGGSVELALALATLGGEVPHQILVGVAEDVVAVGPVLREVEPLVLEDRDQVREPFDHLLSAAELGRVVEVRHVGQLVGVFQRLDDLLVNLIADVGLALEGDQVREAGPVGDRDRREKLPGELVADVLDEEQDEDVVLVLAGVHPAAELVAARPEGGVEF